MDKEEIKRDLTNLSYTHNQFSTVINNALQYIQHLEQKEFILDKVTDKLKDTTNDDNLSDVEYQFKRELAQEILNIIEGEKEK